MKIIIKKSKSLSTIKGFSLLELIMVVAIVVLIGSMGVGMYLNYGKTVEVNGIAQSISYDLKDAQSKAMTGEGGFKWGIHFFNTTNDNYQIFSTATDYSSATVASTSYLPSTVTFSSPASGLSTDIIFSRISGTTTPSSVVLVSQGNTRTVSVSSLGSISVQ
jgi:prepilin-type N-terminal cleavage/methylation domain-containing protein